MFSFGIRISLHHLPSHTFRRINLCAKPHTFPSNSIDSLVPGRQREGNLKKDYNPFQLSWWIEFDRKTTQNLFLYLWPNQPSHQIGTPGPQLIEFAQRQTLVLHIRMRREEERMKRIDWVVVSDYFCTDSVCAGKKVVWNEIYSIVLVGPNPEWEEDNPQSPSANLLPRWEEGWMNGWMDYGVWMKPGNRPQDKRICDWSPHKHLH